jgi:hypothetical protein
MGTNRIPGPVGRVFNFGCSLTAGPTRHQWSLDLELPEEVTPITPGTIDRNVFKEAVADAFKAFLAARRQADEDELKLLVKVYKGVMNKKGDKSYTYWDKEKKNTAYRVDDYVNDRNAFFGSGEAYQTALAEAREELEADNTKLRRLIEPPLAQRKTLHGWEKAQDIFYAWLRKAYQNKLGTTVDIPKLIKSQMSEKLRKALEKVKLDYGKSFQSGGFNPRPMKLEGGYRLGTISEHALGTAIDIESGANAQIKAAKWKHILEFTGKSMAHATRQSKWKNAPKELFDHIVEVNDEFVKRLEKQLSDLVADAKKNVDALKGLVSSLKAVFDGDEKNEAIAAEEEQLQNAEKEYQAISKDPLAAAVKKDADLKAISKEFLSRWKSGFFELPWELVKELHEENFLWGATFDDPDLHHFEL